MRKLSLNKISVNWESTSQSIFNGINQVFDDVKTRYKITDDEENLLIWYDFVAWCYVVQGLSQTNIYFSGCFIHPCEHSNMCSGGQGVPTLTDRFKINGWLSKGIFHFNKETEGNNFDTQPLKEYVNEFKVDNLMDQVASFVGKEVLNHYIYDDKKAVENDYIDLTMDCDCDYCDEGRDDDDEICGECMDEGYNCVLRDLYRYIKQQVFSLDNFNKLS